MPMNVYLYTNVYIFIVSIYINMDLKNFVVHQMNQSLYILNRYIH